jgi:hypothetical protein
LVLLPQLAVTLSQDKSSLEFGEMKCKVQLYVAGKVFHEIVEARDYQDARETALARNPTAKVMGVTAVFD